MRGWIGLVLLCAMLAACGGKNDRDTTDDPPGWLHTGPVKLKIDGQTRTVQRLLNPDGSVWMGRGANLHDTRNCDTCSYTPLELRDGTGLHRQADAVKQRADELIGWGANYIHLVMDSYAVANGRVQYQNVVNDPLYLNAIREIVGYITARQVYVLLYLHDDPCLGETPGSTPQAPRHIGAPGPDCDAVWETLATVFRKNPYVHYGLAAEPTSPADGTPNDCTSLDLCSDREVRDAFDARVAAIRAVESRVSSELPRHIIAVQGTHGYGRSLDVYLTHPITAGGGENIIYETHPYNPQADFDALVFGPAAQLPVVIGEFGPVVPPLGTMGEADIQVLIERAEQQQIPYLAWSFHPHCTPNLLVDYRLDAGAPTIPSDSAPGSGYELCFAPARQGFTPMPLTPAPFDLDTERGLNWGELLYCRWQPQAAICTP